MPPQYRCVRDFGCILIFAHFQCCDTLWPYNCSTWAYGPSRKSGKKVPTNWSAKEASAEAPNVGKRTTVHIDCSHRTCSNTNPRAYTKLWALTHAPVHNAAHCCPTVGAPLPLSTTTSPKTSCAQHLGGLVWGFGFSLTNTSRTLAEYVVQWLQSTWTVVGLPNTVRDCQPASGRASLNESHAVEWVQMSCWKARHCSSYPRTVEYLAMVAVNMLLPVGSHARCCAVERVHVWARRCGALAD